MKPYSSYKPSGIPWLAPIPAHWETKRAKRLFHKMERPPQHNDKVVTCFRDGAVTLRENRRTEGFTESLQEIGYQGIREGDLVVHNMDAFAGAIGVSDSDGKGTPVYSVCTMTPDANAHYYAATIREMARSQWVTALATGIRERSTDFRYATLAQQILPVPPPDEQATIVRYLDYADDLINRYISAKERLIALLEEQRQAVIHQAVTRGLDPHVPLKPSHIPQVRDIPSHWSARRLKNLADVHFSNVDKHTQDDEIPIELCNYVDVYRNDYITKHIPFMTATADQSEIDRFRLQIEDVLITKDSEVWNDIGVPSLVKHTHEHLICGYHVAILRPWTTALSGRFLFRVLQDTTISYQFHIAANGVTRFGLAQGTIKSVITPRPPIDEQEAIADFLDKQTETIQTEIERGRRQIGLLHEYRTRLIADVVTGQIDVRDAAIDLPN